MQVGHVAVALAIATFDWNPETIVVVSATQLIPNLDVILIKAGIKESDFHCTISHSLLFALIISALFLPFSIKLAGFALISILAHYLADLGSTVGLPLLWPFSKKKYSFALWQDTGYWGKAMVIGYYRQPWAWITEIAVFAFLIYRLQEIL